MATSRPPTADPALARQLVLDELFDLSLYTALREIAHRSPFLSFHKHSKNICCAGFGRPASLPYTVSCPCCHRQTE